MIIYSIYIATNQINGKVYVGFSSNWKVRRRRHKSIYGTTNNKFYDAIKKYGWDAFIWEEIYCSLDKEYCYGNMEQYFIEQYDAISNGYNMIQGGSGVLGAVKDKIWINNGELTRRVNEDQIPLGWDLGRLKIKRSVSMSDESKQSIGSKNRTHSLRRYQCPHCDRTFNSGNLSKHIKTH